jgi:sec-independent protein translocase protein TatA
MPFIGHLPEVFIILLVALLVFGPKRMVEMGSSLGKAFRDFRESVKDIPGMDGISNLGGLLRDDEPRRTPFTAANPPTAGATVDARPPTADPAASAPPALPVVEADPPHAAPAETPAAAREEPPPTA